jgi:prefoldin subunit 4
LGFITTQEELEYYDDLEMELELADEDGQILWVFGRGCWEGQLHAHTPLIPLGLISSYRIGEAFFNLTLPAANKHLRQDKTILESQLKKLEKKVEECETEMKSLKVELCVFWQCGFIYFYFFNMVYTGNIDKADTR